MTSFFPQMPPTNGDEFQQKAYQLWLLTTEINERLLKIFPRKKYQELEAYMYSSTLVLLEFMNYQHESEFLEIKNRYLQFLFYEVQKSAHNLTFRVRPHYSYNMPKAVVEDEKLNSKVLEAIKDTNNFILTRSELYIDEVNSLLENNWLPFISTHLISIEPLKHPKFISELKPMVDINLAKAHAINVVFTIKSTETKVRNILLNN